MTERIGEKKPTGGGTVAGDFIAEGPAHNVQIPIVGDLGDLDLGDVEAGELRCHLFSHGKSCDYIFMGSAPAPPSKCMGGRAILGGSVGRGGCRLSINELQIQSCNANMKLASF